MEPDNEESSYRACLGRCLSGAGLADYGKEPTMRRHQAAVSTYERHAEMRMRGMPDLQRANDPYWSPCDYNSNTPIINSCF